MNQELVKHGFEDEDFSNPYTLEFISRLFARNLINTGELAEQAIAKTSKIAQHPRNTMGSDFTDGSEAKYTTVYYNQNTGYATIGGTKNKTGTIRGWVYDEKKTKKNYYFLIPYEVYSLYFSSKSTMKIFFSGAGKPRNPEKNTNPNLWECKVTKREFFRFKQK